MGCFALAAAFTLWPRPASALDSRVITDELDAVVFVVSPPDDHARLFVVELAGTIRIVDLASVTLVDTPFLDISAQVSTSGERGLLGLAFPPDYADSGYFYVHYNDLGGSTTLARFAVDPTDPNLADPDSEVVLLTVGQPRDVHKGGTIAFGPSDGYLYAALGDGNGAPNESSQEGGSLLGKILRLDVSDPLLDGYAIPADNPYVGPGDPLDEIWAFGLRNPFRWSFDRETGDMYIGDVGSDEYEEIDFIATGTAGGVNFGWPCEENDACTGLSGCDCGAAELTRPIFAEAHSIGRCATIGGYVYRGSAIEEIVGRYFYADWCGGQFSFVYDGTDVTDWTDHTSELTPPFMPPDFYFITSVSAFGEDAFGELYVLDYGFGSAGEVFKIVPDDIDDRDCNGNYIVDEDEIGAGLAADCDGNGIVDECEIADGTAVDADGNGVIDGCEIELLFLRGDGNGDGSITTLDAIYNLSYQFGGGSADCLAALDNDDDGDIGLIDAIAGLLYLFASGPSPLPPFPDCGLDGTPNPGGPLSCFLSSNCN